MKQASFTFDLILLSELLLLCCRALKRTHVGISIISAPNLEAKQHDATAALGKKSKASTLEASLRELQEAQDELDHVELGDASVASPFMSRAMSIKCCKDVL